MVECIMVECIMVECIMVECIMVECVMVRCTKEGGGGASGGYVTRHCDFPKRTQKFSQASIAILKACGSDKSSVKFESLICLPPYYLNRK